MIAFTLRALLSRWPRLVLSAVTVAFGVAIVTGTIVFSDTTHAAYRHLFSDADSGAQLIVSGAQVPGTGTGVGADAAQTPGPPGIPPRLVSRISRLSQVAAAAGQILAPATIVGADGRPLDARPQTVAFSALPARFNGVRLLSGAAPAGARQVVVDASTAAQQHWSVGDRIVISTGLPAERFTITGVATLGSGGGERFIVFTSAEAHRLYASPDVSQVEVALAPGADLNRVRTRIAALLPPGLVVRARGAQVASAVNRVSAAFSSLSAALLAFAAVAVLLGALVILNAFASTATQRRQELALLRALGATRNQVLLAGVLDACVIGLLGALLGVVAGPFVALAIRALFADAGVGVASGPLSVSARAIFVGFGVGIGVSLLAAVIPTLSARRAGPIEALRSAHGAHARRGSRVATLGRLGVSAGLGAGGFLLMLSASGDEHQRLVRAGIGGGLALCGVLLAGPLIVAAVIWLAGRRSRDPIFELAREQAMVNRGRVALSGSSLMIAVALALVISVYISGLRTATRAAIHTTVLGDVVVESENGLSPIPASSVRAVSAVPDLAAVSSLKTLTARLGAAGSVQVAGIDPTSWPQVYAFSWVPGAAARVSALRAGQVLVEADTARADRLRVGARLTLEAPDGRHLRLRVAGIYRDAGLLTGITVPVAYFDSVFAQSQLQDVFVRLTGAVSRQVAVAALARALTPYPGVVVRDQQGLASRLAANVTNVADLLDGLLVLAVLMSLLGIGGSLNLTVQTRSREIGVLRALGMTPRQAGALVRDESLLTALVGGGVGIALGVGLALGLSHVLAPQGVRFVFPWPACAGAVGATALAGWVAALAPSRRAQRVGILAAITYE